MNQPMRSYPIPFNDVSRTRLIEALNLSERRGDPFFAHVTEMTRQLFGAPIAYLSLIGGEEQCLLHVEGADVDGTPRQMSLCAFTVAAKETIVLHDTHLDPRSVDHPVVTDAFRLRFSASAPVILSSGFCIGTLCAVDMVPHDPATPGQVETLERLAAMVARFYEAPSEPRTADRVALAQIAEDAQNEFLALIGHELRTPLNGVFGLAQLMDRSDPMAAELARAMQQSASLLNDVVGSILAFTELRSGDVAVDDGPLDVAELLREAVEAAGPSMRLRGKACGDFRVPDALPLTGDGAKLRLAFACLMANFVVHGGGNACIEAGRMEDGTTVVAFSDDGPGISAEVEAATWRAFGLGQSVYDRTQDGIGLGLPLTRRIVELHGGELSLERLDPGVRAVIRLPAWRRGM